MATATDEIIRLSLSRQLFYLLTSQLVSCSLIPGRISYDINLLFILTKILNIIHLQRRIIFDQVIARSVHVITLLLLPQYKTHTHQIHYSLHFTIINLALS